MVREPYTLWISGIVIWRDVVRDGKPNRKGGAVIDMRPLNKATENDIYPISKKI